VLGGGGGVGGEYHSKPRKGEKLQKEMKVDHISKWSTGVYRSKADAWKSKGISARGGWGEKREP